MRLEQDINFEVGGVPCVMRGAITCDIWIITSRDPIYEEGHPEKFGAHFASRISDALEKLAGLDEDGCQKREPRQKYEWRNYGNHALLQVMDDGLGFYGSQCLVRLLADWKDGVPEIRFARSDGTIIEFEKFLDVAPVHTTSLSWDALDDLTV